MGAISANTLTLNWRYATVLIAVIVAALPGVDPVTMTMETLPLVALYVLSIVLLKWVEHRNNERARAEAADAAKLATLPATRPARASRPSTRFLDPCSLISAAAAAVGTVRVIYLFLALVMVVGLVVLGIGTGNTGGLLNADNNGGGGGGNVANQAVKRAIKAVKNNPSAANWASLILARYSAASGHSATNSSTGVVYLHGRRQAATPGRRRRLVQY